MQKETSKFFKFVTVDKQELKKVLEPESIDIFVCNIWMPNDLDKETYMWVSSVDLGVFDRIESKLVATEVQLEEVYRIQKDFLNYSLMPNIFLYE